MGFASVRWQCIRRQFCAKGRRTQPGLQCSHLQSLHDATTDSWRSAPTITNYIHPLNKSILHLFRFASSELYGQADYQQQFSFPSFKRNGFMSLGTWTWQVWTQTGSPSGHWDRPVPGEDLGLQSLWSYDLNPDGAIQMHLLLLLLLWTLTYQLAEGNWHWCTVCQHQDPLSLEKGQQPHALGRRIVDMVTLP